MTPYLALSAVDGGICSSASLRSAPRPALDPGEVPGLKLLIQGDLRNHCSPWPDSG
jgi:hypothetical protein